MEVSCFAIIMAGGKGERFWPLSSAHIPKPFIPLLGDTTMIQDTVARITRIIPEERVLVVLSQNHLALAREQLPQLPAGNFIVEPVGRDTAACIGLAALHVEQMDRDASVVILAADHRITEENTFVETVAGALSFLRVNDYIITIGIKPTRPETGYGYIEQGDELGSLGNQLFYKVSRFVEKPDPSTAQRYLASGAYCWNTGIFISKNKTIQEELSAFMPELWDGLQRIKHARGDPSEDAVMRGEFSRFKKVSFDYGVLEKSRRIAIVPAHFDWDDIGTWNALERVCNRDHSHNVIKGKHAGYDTRNCIIYNNQEAVIVTLGVQDLVIVQVRGRILICPKERASSLKEIMPMIEERGL